MSRDIRQKYLDDYAKAEKLFNENRLADSLEIYLSLLRIQPSHLPVLNNTGLVYERMGDFGNAAEYYKKCYDQAPGQMVVVHNLANAYTQLGKWEEALPLLEKVLKSDIEHESNSEKYALGLTTVRSTDQAKEFILLALARYPDNAVLNRLLGRTLLAMDSHAEGLEYLQKGSGFIEFDSYGVTYLN